MNPPTLIREKSGGPRTALLLVCGVQEQCFAFRELGCFTSYHGTLLDRREKSDLSSFLAGYDSTRGSTGLPTPNCERGPQSYETGKPLCTPLRFAVQEHRACTITNLRYKAGRDSGGLC